MTTSASDRQPATFRLMGTDVRIVASPARHRRRRGAAARLRRRLSRFRPTPSSARSTPTRARPCRPPRCCARPCASRSRRRAVTDGLVDPVVLQHVESAGYIGSWRPERRVPLAEALGALGPAAPAAARSGGALAQRPRRRRGAGDPPARGHAPGHRRHRQGPCRRPRRGGARPRAFVGGQLRRRPARRRHRAASASHPRRRSLRAWAPTRVAAPAPRRAGDLRRRSARLAPPRRARRPPPHRPGDRRAGVQRARRCRRRWRRRRRAPRHSPRPRC